VDDAITEASILLLRVFKTSPRLR